MSALVQGLPFETIDRSVDRLLAGGFLVARLTQICHRSDFTLPSFGIEKQTLADMGVKKTLNVDFDGPSLDFLGSRKSAHEGIKERYPRKSRDELAGDKLTVCEQELL